MKIFRRLAYVVMALSLVACIEKADPKFKPGDDPFVRALFEKHLLESGIPYKKDSEGFYISTREDVQKMHSLSDLAYSEASQTSSLEVSPGCALNKLLAHLDGEGAAYIVDKARTPYLVKTTTSDARKYRVMEIYAGAQRECSEN